MAAAARVARRAGRGAAARRRRGAPARAAAASSQLAGGERLRYDDLLIATGSEPVRLPALAGFANVQALRTFDDAVTAAGRAVGGRAR